MQQALPSIPPEVKERLHANGFKPYKAEPISAFQNPTSSLYWGVNALVFFLAWHGRKIAVAHGSPRFFWGTTMVSIPLCALMTKARLDHPVENVGHRKTLDERLDYSPITRRAWERALQENQKYQDELKQEIESLEKRLKKH